MEPCLWLERIPPPARFEHGTGKSADHPLNLPGLLERNPKADLKNCNAKLSQEISS